MVVKKRFERSSTGIYELLLHYYAKQKRVITVISNKIQKYSEKYHSHIIIYIYILYLMTIINEPINYYKLNVKSYIYIYPIHVLWLYLPNI